MAKVMPKRQLENIGLGITGACVLLVAVVVLALIVMVAQQGLTTFFVDGFDPIAFLIGQHWIPEQDMYGALPMIVGSFSVTLLSTLIALPIALGSAMFVVEVAPGFGTRVFQPLVELLVGIPSVVYGVLGLYVVNSFMRLVFGAAAGTGAGILSGSIVLAVMILPTVINISETSIRAVPAGIKSSSLALGASHVQTIFRSILPAAKSGIVTAIVLGVGRAIGEAMAITLVSGSSVNVPLPFNSVRFLTTAIVSEMGYSSGLHRQVLFTIGLVLFVFIMIINVVLNKILKKGADDNE